MFDLAKQKNLKKKNKAENVTKTTKKVFKN